MKSKVLILAGCISLFFCSCKTYTIDDLPDTHLHFGNGGGFTGMTTEYMLLKNGQLFVREGRAGMGAWQELERITKSAAKDLYQTWAGNEQFRENINEPGNMYYFISMKRDSVEFRQSWGSGTFQPEAALKDFYQQAMEIVRPVDKNPKK